MKRAVTFLVSLGIAAGVYSQQTQQRPAAAELEIQVQKPIAKSSPLLYGLMTEEINYSYDGGLYAELVRNRTFQDSTYDIPAWFVVEDGNSVASIKIDKSTGPSTALPLSLKLTVEKADASDQAGIKNVGFWGIPARPSTPYHASFYAKAENASIGPVTVSLVNNDTGNIVATSTTGTPLGTDWKQYSVELNTGDVQASATNHVTFTVQHPGTVWFQLMSLFPPTYQDRGNGNRIDLMEKMAAMKAGFLRMPGGNYLEGDHIPERFQWKKTIGPVVDRPTHRGPWRYHSSDGMGLLEFLYWCEDLHIQPILAVYAGYSLAQEHVTTGPELEPYVQDALEEIEYVTGATTTKWGAVRTKNGHPEPFPLKFVEIGNEDFLDRSGSYEGRYAQFHDAIRKKYPQLQLIATTPVKSREPDVIDDHFYRRPEEFYTDTHHYDKTDRKGPKIFVGEWATREGTPTPNFDATLGDAAWMTGMERNSDIVVMASYAPLFVNVNPGGMQWDTNLIGYNALTSYGSPSYYAQVMFSNHRGDQILESNLDGGGPRLFYSVTRDSGTGVLFLKFVNASSMPQEINVKLNGATQVDSNGELITLSAKALHETNTISEQTKIMPVQSSLSGVGTNFRHTFPGYSIVVMEVKVK
jgi:alpha-N-arabinofuranosidase